MIFTVLACPTDWDFCTLWRRIPFGNSVKNWRLKISPQVLFGNAEPHIENLKWLWIPACLPLNYTNCYPLPSFSLSHTRFSAKSSFSYFFSSFSSSISILLSWRIAVVTQHDITTIFGKKINKLAAKISFFFISISSYFFIHFLIKV